MAELVADCPRCGARRTTFDVKYSHVVATRYSWMSLCEVHAICRHCAKGTLFVVAQKKCGDAHIKLVRDGLHNFKANINSVVEVERYIGLRDSVGVSPPQHLPSEIDAAFIEGAACLAINCPNAAASMFRLCVDHATNKLLPDGEVEGLNAKTRRSLGLRMAWLFRTGRLSADLQELSTAIKEDGNDGAHDGTLTKADAEDLLDFATALLERLYTEPERLKIAKARREDRRKATST